MVKRELRLEHNGQKLRVPVKFDTQAHIGDFDAYLNACIRWEHAMKEHPSDKADEAYGRAIMSLYTLVFGEQWAKTIETFFGEDALAMVQAVNPYILQRVVPDVRKVSVMRQEEERRKFLRERKKAVRDAKAQAH